LKLIRRAACLGKFFDSDNRTDTQVHAHEIIPSYLSLLTHAFLPFSNLFDIAPRGDFAISSQCPIAKSGSAGVKESKLSASLTE
jgi:hypothetical protein